MRQRRGRNIRLFILEHSEAEENRGQKYQTIKAVTQANREFLFTRTAEHLVQKIRGDTLHEAGVMCYK